MRKYYPYNKVDQMKYTEVYDDELQKSLNHLRNYPQYLPFIGNAWEYQGDRILFIGESHYLPDNCVSDTKTWYESTSNDLIPDALKYINTRDVIKDADNYTYHNKAYTIFYNIKSAVLEARQLPKSKGAMFHNFGYYNYFQRPAENTGMSIKNQYKDNIVAYSTLKTIVQLTQPTAIIFTSKLAYNSFKAEYSKDGVKFDNSLKIHHVPHPACAWWNKKSKNYGTSSNPITGKAKFINIIKALNLNLY